MKVIPNSGINILFLSTYENIADVPTKQKPTHACVNNKIWDERPSYLRKTNKCRMPGKTIQELKSTTTMDNAAKKTQKSS